jgi:hypothetical protein
MVFHVEWPILHPEMVQPEQAGLQRSWWGVFGASCTDRLVDPRELEDHPLNALARRGSAPGPGDHPRGRFRYPPPSGALSISLRQGSRPLAAATSVQLLRYRSTKTDRSRSPGMPELGEKPAPNVWRASCDNDPPLYRARSGRRAPVAAPRSPGTTHGG